MKKTLLLTGVLLALCAASALAAPVGLNLGWSSSGGIVCPSTSAAVVDASDPCDNNGNFYLAIGSFVPAPGLEVAGVNHVTAQEIILDLQEGAPALSDWWHLEAGGCRDGSLTPGCFFPNAGLPVTVCKNYWIQNASGGSSYIPNFGGPDRAELQQVYAVTASNAKNMLAGTEYYSFTMSLDTNHAVADPGNGVLPCQGCQNGVCLVLNNILLDQAPGTPGGNQAVSGASFRQFITWQGGHGTDCPQATPTHRSSWGQVKSLYR